VFDAIVRLLRDLWLALKRESGRGTALVHLVRRYLVIVRAVGWLLTHRATVARLRESIQHERVAPDRRITPLLSGKIFDDVGPTHLQGLANSLSVGYCRLIGIRIAEHG
jgi:hypothetical protein